MIAFVYHASVGAIPGIGPYLSLAIGFATLTLCERTWPARLEWKQNAREWLQVVAMFAIVAASLALVEFGALFFPANWFDHTRSFAAIYWPSDWPMTVQVALGFALIQLIAYWSHRLQHEIGLLWRIFGHGTHHTYTKLSAMNWNTTHPFEAVPLVAPAIILSIVFGLTDVAVAAASLVMIISATAHANLRLNERLVGLVLTTNSQHMQHHSSVFAESQTNYSCAMTLWDRIFGTFSERDTTALGDPMDGERTLWKRLTVPLR
ncbi:sterol desaturase family protein [Alteripontixanthobacter maritimus]|uniref:sterol desaturase family protein n=1 Tax=Alteripontixanthobacter maritimus TaxID=2161824 RepID=UPI0015F00D88|nr:sterol desaturase family protein [Alteripontixanthobacter maritimus]